MGFGCVEQTLCLLVIHYPCFDLMVSPISLLPSSWVSWYHGPPQGYKQHGFFGVKHIYANLPIDIPS
jgi:hypothetical protein